MEASISGTFAIFRSGGTSPTSLLAALPRLLLLLVTASRPVFAQLLASDARFSGDFAPTAEGRMEAISASAGLRRGFHLLSCCLSV